MDRTVNHTSPALAAEGLGKCSRPGLGLRSDSAAPTAVSDLLARYLGLRIRSPDDELVGRVGGSTSVSNRTNFWRSAYPCDNPVRFVWFAAVSSKRPSRVRHGAAHDALFCRVRLGRGRSSMRLRPEPVRKSHQ